MNQSANRHVKKYLRSLIIRLANKGKNKIPPYTCDSIRKNRIKQVLVWMSGKKNACRLIVEMQFCPTPVEDSLQIPQSMRSEPTLAHNNSSPRDLSEESKRTYSKYLCTPIFITALFVLAWTWKQPTCLMVKKIVIYMYYSQIWVINRIVIYTYIYHLHIYM